MKEYSNMMETIIEEALDAMLPGLDCCTCVRCRNDMAAWALNQLPPRYVVTPAAGVISKADTMRIQHMTDVRTALVQAAEIVRKNPRH